jgi:hypothetical protein
LAGSLSALLSATALLAALSGLGLLLAGLLLARFLILTVVALTALLLAALVLLLIHDGILLGFYG